MTNDDKLLKRNCRDDGCCCIFDEDGETQLQWCKPHAVLRDHIRELKDLLTECEHVLFIWRGAYVVGERASLKMACDTADATLAKMRKTVAVL